MTEVSISSEEDHSLEIGDILDLTVTELLILKNLMSYPNSNILRIKLLQNLNGMLNSKKQVATSSFYHKLDKLEKRNLIAYQIGKNDKINSINITPLGKLVLGEITKISFFATADAYIKIKEMLPGYIEAVGLKPKHGKYLFENVLIINLEDNFDISVLELISQFGQTTYILAEDDNYQNYLDRGMETTIKQSKQERDFIREPEGYFDAVIIIGYDCIHSKEHTNAKKIMKESYRVLTKEGMIAVGSVEDLPKVNHFVIKRIIDEIVESTILHRTGPDILIKDLQQSGFINPQIYIQDGMLLAWAFKK